MKSISVKKKNFPKSQLKGQSHVFAIISEKRLILHLCRDTVSAICGSYIYLIPNNMPRLNNRFKLSSKTKITWPFT